MSEPIVSSLNHIVGQQRAVTVLRTALDAYWHDRSKNGGKEAFPHLLMCGPGGTGKTLLTELISKELCTECHVELAQNIGNIGQMQGLLMMLEAEHITLSCVRKILAVNHSDRLSSKPTPTTN